MTSKKNTPIKALFLDIGGVLLTNGWDRNARKLAAEMFSLDYDDMNDRHRIIFDAYESGKSSLDEYLRLLVFHKDCCFDKPRFKRFMYQQSEPYPDMIALIKEVKKKNCLKTVAVNNEGKELNEFRIKQFDLGDFIDVFASSCIINARKPDLQIYRIAMELVHVKPAEVLYIDDRLVFIQAAEAIGIRGIHHTNIENTIAALKQYGLDI